MTNTKRGMAAGFIASVALLLIMGVKQMAGIPGADPEQLMVVGLSRLGMHPGLTAGWVTHLLIGVFIWGLLFGYLNDEIPVRSEIIKGLLFSFFTWLLMIVFLMPLASLGASTFDSNGAITTTLIMHLIFGAFLGASYAGFGTARESEPVLR